MSPPSELKALLDALSPDASLAGRHVWLIALFRWLRGDQQSPEAALARLQTLIDSVKAQPELRPT